MENWTQENSDRNQKSTGEPSFLSRPMFAPRILSRILLFYPRSWPWWRLNAKISIILSFNFVSSRRETCSLLFTEQTGDNKRLRLNWTVPDSFIVSSIISYFIYYNYNTIGCVIIYRKFESWKLISKVVTNNIFARDNNKRNKERSFLLTLIPENNNDLR